MPSSPKVSVILTSFNHAKYLREAIDSVLSQTYTDFELIIWDDASTDNSWEIIQSYDDARIKAFRNEKQSLARYGLNKAIQEVARGEYIAIHHSDDVWLPEKLERQTLFLDANPSIGAVFSDMFVIDKKSSILPEDTHLNQRLFAQPNRSRHEWLNHFFYKGNALAHPSVLIRKKCYSDCGVYRFGFPAADYDMWVRLCMRYEIHVLSEKLIKFRIKSNSPPIPVNQRDDQRIKDFQYHLILRNYKQINTPDELREIFPDAEPYLKQEKITPLFIMAMMALHGPQTNNILNLFGMELLFETMIDLKTRKQVEEIYGFTVDDYYRYIIKHNVLFVEMTGGFRTRLAQKNALLAEKDSLLAEKDSLLAEKDSLLAEKDSFIQEIINSKAWRLVTAYRKVLSTFRRIN